MASPSEPEPVKLFVAALWADAEALASACSALIERWGGLDHEGPDHAFDVTGYYESEMGSKLYRRLLGFHEPVSPELLVEAKLATNEIETALSTAVEARRVNLDVGYLDHNKVVLASVKAAGQKVYLARGVYADLILRYAAGSWQSFEWTFPDFRDGRYEQELLKMRRDYLRQLRASPG